MSIVKYSYSRLSTWDGCGWRYKLQYLDKHFCSGDSLATELGTLLHYCEELIGLDLKEGKTPDYSKIKEIFLNANVPKKNPYDTEGGYFGINILADKYHKEFFDIDDKGQSYMSRCKTYLETGIYRLERFMKSHPELEIFDLERPFEFNFEGHIIKGFIDRILKYKDKDEYIIFDIKTKNKLFPESETKSPLQHGIYGMALKEQLGLKTEPSEYYYDLPFIDAIQQVMTKGGISRCKTKLERIFNGIEKQDFTPKPSPLCHWCPYCYTNPNQTEEGKGLCPYYSLWTRENPTFDKMNEWQGLENHQKVLNNFLQNQCTKSSNKKWEF